MSALTNLKRSKIIAFAVLCFCVVSCSADSLSTVNSQGMSLQKNCQYKTTDVEYMNGTIVEYINGIMVLKSNKQPVNGTVCVYRGYGNSGIILTWEAPIVETPYKDGKVEGIRREYYESGKLKDETPYLNGKLEGIEKRYYQNGKLLFEIPYKDDKQEGIEKRYYESGKLRSETPYKNDKREGYHQQYTEKGQLWAKVLYKNDEPVSGTCGNRRVFTNAELINFENGHEVSCGY